MSLADFHDIYRICCDWDSKDVFEEVITVRINQLESDTLPYPQTSRLNRWGEIAEKELLTEKRDGVLV